MSADDPRQRALTARQLATETEARALRLYGRSKKQTAALGRAPPVRLEEALRTATWTARRAHLDARVAVTRAQGALDLLDGSADLVVADAMADRALKAAHHARWLLRAAQDAMERVATIRDELVELAAQAVSQDDEPSLDRKTRESG